MKPKIIFDIGHPAQVHNFKYVYHELSKKGWDGVVTLKDKEVAKRLLDFYHIPYIQLKRNAKSKIGNLIIALINSIRFASICKKIKPKIVVSRNSIHSSIICKLFNIDHIALSDTESAINLSKFVDVVITGNSYRDDLGNNHLKCKINIELFYLHPKRYNPLSDIKDLLKLKKDEKFTLIRFVSWEAHHDKGQQGLSLENKIKSVEHFKKFGKVFISSEKTLTEDLKKYKIEIPPEKMHDVIAAASLVYGESSTMASEAAVLGTPAIYHDNDGRGYTDEEEVYGLVYNYSSSSEDQEKAIKKGEEILKQNKSEFLILRDKFLSSKIDATAFLVWFIENYPTSLKTLKENPDYQLKFRNKNNA